jgi:hypothetical protein
MEAFVEEMGYTWWKMAVSRELSVFSLATHHFHK